MFARLANQKLILIFGVLLIGGIWCFIWQHISSDYYREMAEASREGMNLAHVNERHIRRLLQEADQNLHNLRAAYQEDGLEGQKFQTVLNQIMQEYSQTQIGIVDEHGMLYSLLRPFTEPYDVSDRDYFVFHRTAEVDQLHLGKTIMGRQSSVLVIPLSRRILKSDGSFGGIFVIALSPSYLLESFKDIELGSGKIISVTGMDGITRIRQGEGINKQSIDVRSGAVYQNAQRAPFGTVLSPNVEDGIMRLNAYRVLPEYGVYINVAMSEQDILANFTRRKYRNIAAASFSTLLILFFCRQMIRNNMQQRVLEGQIRDDAKRLAALQKITSRLVTNVNDSDSLLRTIVVDAISLVNASNGFIATVEPGGQEWTLRYGAGIHEKRIGEKLSIAEDFIGEVISRQELVFIEDYTRYSACLNGILLNTVRSVLALPLMVKDVSAGILAVDWAHVIPRPGEVQIHSFRQYASLASVALERVQTKDEIYRLAYTDTLTGLPNRRSIQDYLDKEMEKARRGESYGTVVFIDLDNLKMINDTIGHSWGDHLILESSKKIVENSGENAVVGRLAGDEFVVILAGLNDKNKIAKIAANLIRSLDRQYKSETISVHVTASAGVAFYPENGSTVEEILKNADTALYAAKNNGKHSWQYYNATIQQDMQERMVIANYLRQALNRKELLLYYQPILTPEGALVGFEALLRWNSMEHGFMLPSRFIFLVEQDIRLVQSIGTWVLQEACMFIKRLAGMGGGNLVIEVNVSPRQLESGNFGDIVLAAINTAGIEPRQLGLEITESVFVKSVQNAAGQLNQLREQGVKVFLDDFGEGYSSLTQLSMLPVNTLKMSRMLTQLLGGDERQVSFVRAIVHMARALGLTVVAEGVETLEQLRKAKECGCDWIQGYYFYRPMPEEEAIKLVRDIKAVKN